MVVSVFDLADCPSYQRLKFADLTPFGTYLLVHFQNEEILLPSPFAPNNVWVENIVPSLAALATESSWKISGYDNPVLGAELHDLISEQLVLLWCPLVGCQDLSGHLHLKI